MSKLKVIMWAIIAGLLGLVVWLALDTNAPFGRNTVSLVSRTFAPIVQPIVQQFPCMQFGTLNQPVTVLFMGTDVVYTDSRRRQADRQALNGNSDTMMLVFLNPAHKSVSVINIPRDTEANVGRYGVRKINSANLIGGPELARETVSNLLNVHIDHYVVMNIQALVEMVNELGGVTVYVPKKMNYMDWTGKLKIDLEPGYHTLTGNQAMGFVRFRHDSLGDIGRIQRQQLFLQAASKKMLQPSSWLHINNLLEIAQRNIQTDMSNVDIFQTLNFAHDVPKDQIKFVMLPGSFADNGDWIANTESLTLAQNFANPDLESVRSRRNISVCIINASEDKTKASELAKELRKIGYRAFSTRADGELAGKSTRIIAQYGNVAEARMLRQDLGNIGEIVNASVGNLQTSLTVEVHDDIALDKISLSSPDAPYVPRAARPQPLVSRPVLTAKRRKQVDMEAPEAGLEMIDEMPAEASSTSEGNQNDSSANDGGLMDGGAAEAKTPDARAPFEPAAQPNVNTRAASDAERNEKTAQPSTARGTNEAQDLYLDSHRHQAIEGRRAPGSEANETSAKHETAPQTDKPPELE